MKYVYEGPGPIGDGDGGIVRPGDEREFGEEPSWGPWAALKDPETPEKPAAPPATPAPALAPPSPPPASVAPPAPRTGD